jgi:hypothetical protein
VSSSEGVRELAAKLLRNTFLAGKVPETFLAETFLRCLLPYHEGCWSA